mgnify:CR=1 FL=1
MLTIDIEVFKREKPYEAFHYYKMSMLGKAEMYGEWDIWFRKGSR